MDENTESGVVLELPEIMTVIPGDTFPVTVVDDRPFMTTPLDDYTVTEGLLLLILGVIIIKIVADAIKEGFYWLW